MTVAAGRRAFASEYNSDIKVGQCLAHAERVTNSGTTTTTEIAVERLDNIPIIAGRRYSIQISPLAFNSTVAGDLIAVNIRASTTGSATTSSTILTGINEGSHTASGSQRTKGGSFTYTASATGSLSLLLTVQRVTGTGTVGLIASATLPLQIDVFDAGVDPGDTGVDL